MFRRLALVLSLASCAAPQVKSAPASTQCRDAPRDRAEPATPQRAPVRGLANIQRTMRLLTTSSAEHPNRVRILFYGQSITQSAWSRQVEAWLRSRYPHAALEIQNRALGGFAADRLSQTAETDLYPFQPDLVIFHVYGAHDRYEQIVRELRQRTTAELLVQTDHVTRPEQLDEPRDACASPPDAAHWDAFMNQVFLPSLVDRYQTAVCDLRASWKLHLRAHRLPPSALLLDEVHVNARGDQLMAALVESCLRDEPALRSPAEDWVEAIDAALLERIEGGARLAFRGNRVVATVQGDARLQARIDGALPCSLPGVHALARAHAREGGKWPPLHGIDVRTPVAPEMLTFNLQRIESGSYAFTLTGSRSGDEGAGATDRQFVSRSGRITIEPSDWDIDYAFLLAGVPVPAQLHVDVRVEPQCSDAITSAGERAVTIASGLTNGPHLLELAGDLRSLRAIEIHRPPL